MVEYLFKNLQNENKPKLDTTFLRSDNIIAMRFLVHILLLVVASNAAPLAIDASLEARQIGDIQCNVERGKTVAALGNAVKEVKKLAKTATYWIFL